MRSRLEIDGGTRLVFVAIALTWAFAPANAAPFPLFGDGVAAPIVTDPNDAPVVRIAAQDLATDVERVTGSRPSLVDATTPTGTNVVVIGTLGRNRFIDGLVATGKIDVEPLRGAWETFLIATVEHPSRGIARALVVVGSDRRGTAYGAYEMSAEIGVSPWVWWADVAPLHKNELIIPDGWRKFGPPSVRYRGIFINDEDWSLIPWAARTFDPQTGNLGPKTYTEVFRLLLRLKANTLWPAMHKISTPFNRDPANARLADDFAIVMGSSHAEPMLRNNVGEWTDAAETFNYATNRRVVRTYWEQRVRTNARFESLWTLGMRGIHDSGMVGPVSTDEKVQLMEEIFSDQRALLRRHVARDVEHVPQLFVPYKEVLPLYEAGLKVPEDVTIVWPDDNYGYIRRFPDVVERRRSGGGGVYYHLSYLGAPLAYLWLSTTPPALVQQEMTRAYDLGARQLWIANVGDIKPAEIGISHFLELAWDIDAVRRQSQRDYLATWCARTFDLKEPDELASILDEYFRLNFERRPEHLQWWLPGEMPRRSPLSDSEVSERLARFDSIVARVRALEPSIAKSQRDAFFELVEYPVRSAAAANRRYFGAERYAQEIDRDARDARSAAAEARAADAEIRELTAAYNDEIAGGKWRHMMTPEPADNQWARFRASVLSLPADGIAQEGGRARVPADPEFTAPIEAEHFQSQTGWRFVQGLGRGEGSMFADRDGAAIAYEFEVPSGIRSIELGVLPLFPSSSKRESAIEVRFGSHPPQMITLEHAVETPAWAQAVLDNELRVPIGATLDPGKMTLTLIAHGTGIAIDRILLRP